MEAFVGSIFPVGFSFAPSGWMSCEGQQLPINNYQALFALLGTTFGGNGATTFALPDLRGRTIVGQGQGAGLTYIDYGETGGNYQTTISLAQMPPHTHVIQTKANAFSATSSDPTNNYFGGSGPNIYDPATDGTLMNPAAISCGTAGASQPIDLMNPFLATYQCICIEGIFPSRN